MADEDLYGGPLGTRDLVGADEVAFTFDDGPSPEWTPTVLDFLAENDINATFCLIGQYAQDYPYLVKRIAAEGHTLCNHAWYHEHDLGSQDREDIEENMLRTNAAIREAAGPNVEIPYYRQPGGQWTERVISVADELGMESIHWTVDPGDWNSGTSRSYIEDHVLEKSSPGAIILLHDGAGNQESMFPALEAIVSEFADRGYGYTAL